MPRQDNISYDACQAFWVTQLRSSWYEALYSYGFLFYIKWSRGQMFPPER